VIDERYSSTISARVAARSANFRVLGAVQLDNGGVVLGRRFFARY